MIGGGEESEDPGADVLDYVGGAREGKPFLRPGVWGRDGVLPKGNGGAVVGGEDLVGLREGGRRDCVRGGVGRGDRLWGEGGWEDL